MRYAAFVDLGMRHAALLTSACATPRNAYASGGYLRAVVALVVLLATFAFAPVAAGAKRHPPSPVPILVPLASPTPLSDVERVARLRARVDELGRIDRGHLGIAIVDLFGDTHVSLRGADPVALGGIEKLAIGFAAYRLVDQQRLRLEDRVTVTATDLRGAPSPIAALHPHGDVSYTYWELIRAMLVTGDNTASSVVLRRIGGPAAVQGILDRLGLRGIRMSSDADGRNGSATPDTVAALLAGIVEHRLLFLDTASEFYDALSHAETEPARLRSGLGAAVTLASMSGTAAGSGSTTAATNDAGIVTFPYGRRVIVAVFLAGSDADAATRDAAIADVARAVDEAFR